MSDDLSIETDDEPEMGHRGEIIVKGLGWHAEKAGGMLRLYAAKHGEDDGIMLSVGDVGELYAEVVSDE